MEGYYEVPSGGSEGPKRHDLFVVNLATVDQPQDSIDLSSTKVRYFDMLNNNYGGGLKEAPWPNGLV